jgi:hypothetical protein
MPAYLVLLLAVLSRILPHAFHAVSWNFTALGGSLLFFGSQLGADRMRVRQTNARGLAWRTAAKLASALAVLMATDYYLTVFAYQYPFHILGYIVTWVWYAAVCLIGMGLLSKPSTLRVIAGVLASSTSFFILVDFALWAGGAMYPHTLAGLEACYIAAVPFYRNDLVSTAITAGALFGLPVLAAKIVETLHAASNNDLPLA